MITNFEESFIAYARLQNPERDYPGYLPERCALGQFVASRGYRGHAATYEKAGEDFRYPAMCYHAAVGSGPRLIKGLFDDLQECTWGQLLQRYERLKALSPETIERLERSPL